MLHIQNLSYSISGRPLFENANATIAKNYHVGFVGRNGAGKSTLFRLILGSIHPDKGEVSVQKGATIGTVAQETPSGSLTCLEFVLKSDKERTHLLELTETETDPTKLGDIYDRLLEIDAYSAPAKASKILVGLGFSEEMQHQSLDSFSGGWKMRVALATALFLEPDLLLLDEPSNHLDLETTLWLVNYLKSYPKTLVIISHDRYLLNAAVDRILHLNHKSLSIYTGNYDTFIKTRAEQKRVLEAAQKKQQAERAHVQKFVDRFRFKASKAKQVQSRIKKLEKLEQFSDVRDDPTLALHFPEPETLPPPLITLEKVSAGYGEKVVLTNLNQRIDFGDRIALLGANGNGKSTFAKLIAGALAPLKGERKCLPQLRIGFFHQHQLEGLIPKKTAYDHLVALMNKSTPTQVRSYLGTFGFGQAKADIQVEKLSGGEKARLNLAILCYHKPQILILDEPTNHLDMETREALIFAINEFPGAVILITHDWHLLELTADTLWIAENKTVKPFDGSLDEYRQLITGSSSKAPGSSQKEPKNVNKEQKKKSKK
jgi:ATP-binding cassette subfamily F protein 3